ncbi:hypothetical protein ACFE04_013985 [Oxalis oulophora]
MKCRSVACIWSGTPPPHKVTAAAVINHPLTLYTGGSNGSIFCWSISESNSEIKPVAMLCGHAAPIADLAICYPVIASQLGITDQLLRTSGNSVALVSACTDGVLCVWSRTSAHCRRRRKLPPWVGSPSIIQTLSSNLRYVCVGCNFIDSVTLSDHVPLKCSIVVVDTYTLSIVHTIFHGNLSIGPVKYMAVVSHNEEFENLSLLLADSFGRTQLVSKSEGSHQDGEIGDNMIEEEHVLSITSCRNIVAFVSKDHCVFRLLAANIKVGEISLTDNLFLFEGDPTQLHMLGGMFLENDNDEITLNNLEDAFLGSFALWNNRGSAIVYQVSYQDGIFKCKPIYKIPASSRPLDVSLSICFIQLSSYLIRIESICFHLEEPSQWRPHVVLWSLHQQHDESEKLYEQCKMLAVGDSFTGWVSRFNSRNQNDLLEDANAIQAHDNRDNLVHVGQTASSTLVIAGNLNLPYAVVYGFVNGNIETIRFNYFQGPGSLPASPRPDVSSHLTRQTFSGHTGAVLCLAAHHMVGPVNGYSFSHVLISGSMDFTIRIWDLDTGHPIIVMHHHVGPIHQIILPPARTERPWSDCFISVGEDLCVALVSLESLRVERMFPGHPNYPAKVVWDGGRGYIACLCCNSSRTSDANAIDELYIWDVKTGARERVLRGTASHSMFDHFCKSISMNTFSGTPLDGNISVSALLLPVVEDCASNFEQVPSTSSLSSRFTNITEANSKKTARIAYPATPFILQSKKHPIKCSCPFPGIATLSFDLASLMFPSPKPEPTTEDSGKTLNPDHIILDDNGTSTDPSDWIRSLEEYLIQFSLSFLHLWGVDHDLDMLLVSEMKLKRPENFIVASGLPGDNGSLTLTFPGSNAILELWKSSSEFSAMRSLTMVALAQHMISLSHTNSAASSALAAFYTRNFLDKAADIKPPSLQLLVSFWQDESEHVRMAARSAFHCSASRTIPLPLCSQKASDHAKLIRSLSEIEENEHEISNTAKPSENGSNSELENRISQAEESNLLSWLESYEVQDWISCVGGTSQDAMASHIIVAAALAIWYPSLVKSDLASVVVHPLMKLVMAMNEKYSSTAAELLAEGMDSTWKSCIGSEIPRLISDIFFQVECVSGPTPNATGQRPTVPASIREILVETLLPSLAMADLMAFLNVIESQIWSTASDSPVHLVSLMTLIRVVRGYPRNVAPYLDKVVNFILQTMDPGNSVMRRSCLNRSKIALKEVVRVFPMVALNETSTKLAVGDAVGDVNNACIRVYDMQSVAKIKVLDASGPPGLPPLLSGASENAVTTLISTLSFSPDGEGLIAFSENGLMIRWWSLGSVWWEKLSRNFSPVQCTKLIFVPPWEGFSPNSSRSSIMASITNHDKSAISKENANKTTSHADSLKLVIQNLDLSYRLEWVGDRKVLLTRHGQQLGVFPL